VEQSAHLLGLDPARPQRPERMAQTELAAAQEKMAPLIHVAGPNLDRLSQAVGSVGRCILLGDADGVPLKRSGASVDDRVFADWGL
jgi:transcriptional regulator of acetoin/glycerol metabolism